MHVVCSFQLVMSLLGFKFCTSRNGGTGRF